MAKNTGKRTAISKSVRFEVFKRDRFKCQYCGASAPEVLLEIDHLNPVAKGGTNELLNLITACFFCNNGKRDKLLSDDSVISKQKQQLEQLQERREQLEMLLNWHEGLKNIQDDLHKSVKEYWERIAKGWSINENGMLKIRKWAKEFEFTEILQAMDSAAEQYLVFNDDRATQESWDIAFNKVASIIKVNRDAKENPDLKELFYIRAIIRNRLENYDAAQAMEWLKSARSWGATMQELKYIASRAKSWRGFTIDMDDLIAGYRNDQLDESEEPDDMPF